MVALEQIGFSPAEEYLSLFHRYITRSIEALYRRLAAELDTAELNTTDLDASGLDTSSPNTSDLGTTSERTPSSFIIHPSSFLKELSPETREQAWHLLDYGLKLANGWEVVQKLLLALAPHMERGGFRHEWLPYLERGVACCRRVQDRRGEAQLSLYIGRLYRLRGELATAYIWFAASASLCQQINDRRGRAMALNQLAYVGRLQSRNTQATAYVGEALKLLDEHDTERATSHWVLGTIAQSQMEWAQAEVHHRTAMQIWQEAGDQQRATWSLQNLGDTLRSAGRHDEATAYIQQAIVLLGQIHDPVNQAVARMSLGVAHLYRNEVEEALALFTLAEAVFRQVGDQLNLGLVYTNITIAERELGNLPASARAGKKAIRIWEIVGNFKYLANSLDELAVTYLAQQRPAEAMALLEQALSVLSQVPPDAFHEMILNSVRAHVDEAQQLGSA